MYKYPNAQLTEQKLNCYCEVYVTAKALQIIQNFKIKTIYKYYGKRGTSGHARHEHTGPTQPSRCHIHLHT